MAAVVSCVLQSRHVQRALRVLLPNLSGGEGEGGLVEAPALTSASHSYVGLSHPKKGSDSSLDQGRSAHQSCSFIPGAETIHNPMGQRQRQAGPVACLILSRVPNSCIKVTLKPRPVCK